MSNQPPKALKEDEVIHSELMEARRTMRNLVDEMIESAPDEEPATTCITHLTKDQKRRYYVQPDMLPYYIGSMNDDQETLEYVKGLSMRFWYNIQPANFRSHWHTALEIITALEGDFTAMIQQQTYHLNPGDILIIPAGSVHSLSAPPKGTRFIYILELDHFSHLPGFNYILSLLGNPIHIVADQSSDFYNQEASLIMEMAEQYWGHSVTKELNLFSCLLRFFAKIGENNVDEANGQPLNSPKTGSLMNRLTMSLDYLDSHYAENVTLEEVAAVACFSKYYYTRLLKQYTNQTFYDYLSARRIRAAEQLLIVPNLPITEISLKSGFSSLSSFNRTFKRIKGCSPTEYRALYTIDNTRVQTE